MQLALINREITRKLIYFKETDPSVTRLQRERQAILQYIDQTAGGLISIAGGGSKEVNREILLQYKQLQRTAERDSEASAAMHRELLSLQIKKAQSRQPWELISTPTLLDLPVTLRRYQIMAFGLLAGLFAGSGAALVVDRRRGLEFSRDELKRLIPCPLLENLSALSPKSWHDEADLLAQGPLNVSDPGPIGLLPIGNVPSDQLQRFSSELQRALGSRELLVSSDLRQTSCCATQLLLTAPGVVTRTQLSQFKQKLALQGTPLAGWVLLDPDLELS